MSYNIVVGIRNILYALYAVKLTKVVKPGTHKHAHKFWSSLITLDYNYNSKNKKNKNKIRST